MGKVSAEEKDWEGYYSLVEEKDWEGYYSLEGREGYLFQESSGGYYFFECYKGEGFYYQNEESDYFHAGQSLYDKEQGLETLDADLERLALGSGGMVGDGLGADHGRKVTAHVGDGLTAGVQVPVKVGDGLTAGGQVPVKVGNGLTAGRKVGSGRLRNVASFPRRFSLHTPK